MSYIHGKLDQSRKGGDRPVIANSETSAVLESLEGPFSGLTWWSGRKVGETHFWAKIGPKSPKIAQNLYLTNHRSYKVGWPLKMTKRIDLLWAF